ncbi:hypothetical protein [Streptomyces alanosinicus]|uniref:Uncharacterized protein n=1 Tax=Streptomyces alanosinicus TaxID=68171 RepID=A0A919D7S0_9ACTN|nr:hypothetical protein [Streptomyces alanosinicus]GHE11453.1 hypothetical protein GCM10010339_71380 [Streptomyces alanosinicus]
MHRTPYAPAPHVDIRTRMYGSLTRHAFLVNGTRAALLTCLGRCRHDDGTLLNVIGHHTPDAVDDENVTVRWSQLHLPNHAKDGRHLALGAHTGTVTITLHEGRHRLAALSFGGSQWTAEQVQLAAAELIDRTGR